MNKLRPVQRCLILFLLALLASGCITFTIKAPVGQVVQPMTGQTSDQGAGQGQPVGYGQEPDGQLRIPGIDQGQGQSPDGEAYSTPGEAGPVFVPPLENVGSLPEMGVETAGNVRVQNHFYGIRADQDPSQNPVRYYIVASEDICRYIPESDYNGFFKFSALVAHDSTQIKDRYGPEVLCQNVICLEPCNFN